MTDEQIVGKLIEDSKKLLVRPTPIKVGNGETLILAMHEEELRLVVKAVKKKEDGSLHLGSLTDLLIVCDYIWHQEPELTVRQCLQRITGDPDIARAAVGNTITL